MALRLIQYRRWRRQHGGWELAFTLSGSGCHHHLLWFEKVFVMHISRDEPGFAASLLEEAHCHAGIAQCTLHDRG